jgi:hypothetical protein
MCVRPPCRRRPRLTCRVQNGLYVTYSKERPLTWRVSMFNFPPESTLARDLETYSRKFGVVRVPAPVCRVRHSGC